MQEAQMTVTALDDYTVRFVLPVPFAPFLRSVGTAIYPQHVLEPHVNDGTFAETWDIDTDPAEIIGTGPFTIERYDPGERVVLQRNPSYWLKDAAGNRLPYLDTINAIIVPDLETELVMFQAGETDLYRVLGEEFTGLKPLEAAGNFTIYKRGPTFGSTFLGFNMNPGRNPDSGMLYFAPEKLEWFRNTQFRQAVAHSINRTRSSTTFCTASATRSGPPSAQPRVTSTTRMSAGTNIASPRPTKSSTASAGRIPMGTEYVKTVRATRSRSRW